MPRPGLERDDFGTMQLSAFTNDVRTRGWGVTSANAFTREGLSLELARIAATLGTMVKGRGGFMEEVAPQQSSNARIASLSSRYGLNPFPLHTDTAHWLTPCRYLALACVRVGSKPAPTVILDSDVAWGDFSESERMASRSAVFAIRNGRNSFYGSILDESRSFIRIDPGCMMPLSLEGEVALEAFGVERHFRKLIRHDWTVGDILVFDNWRFLHARGVDAPTDSDRLLMRAMVQ